MPANTSLVINSTSANNKKVTNTITHVNPTIGDKVAIELAQKIANLTSDSYTSTERIDRNELGTLPAPPVQYILCDGDKSIVDGVLNIPLTLDKLQNKSITITIKGDCIEKMTRWPIITADEFNCQNWGFITKYSESSNLRNRLTASIVFFEQPVVGQTSTGNFLLPASDTYSELNFDIVFTFMEG